MIETAWTRYCGWAAEARARQAASRRWLRISLGCAIAAAVLGTVADQAQHWDGLPFDPTRVVAIAAGIAALAAALQAWLSNEKLAAEDEAKWVKARAAAEAIKSECYRFAARAGGYAAADAETQFADRIDGLTKDAVEAGLVAADGPPPANRPVPPVPMDKAWYREKRLRDQIGFFADDKAKGERKIALLRLVSVGSMLIAALCGATTAISLSPSAAAWIGVLTTILAAITANGFADRYKQISVKAAMMHNRLGALDLRADALTLEDLVTRTEDLMVAEHALWTALMATPKEDAGSTP